MVYLKAAIQITLLLTSFHTLWAKILPSPSDLNIPARSSTSITGSKLIEELLCKPIAKREHIILEQLKFGNVPDFLRVLKPIKVNFEESQNANTGKGEMIVFVMPDYLAVGSDEDFVRVPLNLTSAIELTRNWNFVLPTTKIVDLIYAQADCKIPPHPLKPGPEMSSPGYLQDHNHKVDQDTPTSASKESLKAGHKKDIVISNRLLEKKNRIAIYGWHKPSGKPIQPLSIVHRSDYADYSHGIRLVYNKVWFKNKWIPIKHILKNKSLASTLSREGPLSIEKSLSNCN